MYAAGWLEAELTAPRIWEQYNNIYNVGRGAHLVLVNVGLFDSGWDCPILSCLSVAHFSPVRLKFFWPNGTSPSAKVLEWFDTQVSRLCGRYFGFYRRPRTRNSFCLDVARERPFSSPVPPLRRRPL